MVWCVRALRRPLFAPSNALLTGPVHFTLAGIHYLSHPLPGMDPGGDLKHMLRFLRERSAKFPFVVVLGPAGVSRGADGRTPWDITTSAVQDLDAALRNASHDEGVSYLDVLSLRSGRSHVVSPADGMHPDQLLGLYIHSMVLTLMGVE